MSTPAPVAVRLLIPSEILDAYETQAIKSNLSPEDLMVRFLTQHKESGNEKPIVIDDETRRQLEQLFRRNISTSKDLLSEVHRAVSVSLAGLEIDLAPRLLERLKTRAIRVPWPEFLKGLIHRRLEEDAGMR